MSGIYTVPFSGALTVKADLAAIVAHATKQCVLLALSLSQTTRGTDAQEEILELIVRSGQTTVGSGGTVPTPVQLDPVGGGAAGFTARTLDTTQASAGTILTHYRWNWNVRGPFDMILPEPMQIIFGAGRRLTFELNEAPSTSMTFSGFVVVQEIG